MMDETPFVHLVAGAVQSRLSWEARIGPTWFQEFLSTGALSPLLIENQVGEIGIFRSPAGDLECKIRKSDGTLTAEPIDGDPAVSISVENGLFRANPRKIFEAIAAANALVLEKISSPDLPELVAVAKRSWSSGASIKVIIALDAAWFSTLAARSLVHEASREVKTLVILKPNPTESLPWHIETNPPQLAAIPSSMNAWKIAPKCFFHSRFGLPESERIEGCSATELVIDTYSKQIIVFGKKLDLHWGTPTQRYLEGSARMAISGVREMSSLEFAREHLNYRALHEQDALNHVKESRKQVKNALKKKFDGGELNAVVATILPENPLPKILATNLKATNVHFFD